MTTCSVLSVVREYTRSVLTIVLSTPSVLVVIFVSSTVVQGVHILCLLLCTSTSSVLTVVQSTPSVLTLICEYTFRFDRRSEYNCSMFDYRSEYTSVSAVVHEYTFRVDCHL